MHLWDSQTPAQSLTSGEKVAPSPWTSSHHRETNKRGLQDKSDPMAFERHPVHSLPLSHPGCRTSLPPSNKGQTRRSGRRESTSSKEEGKSAKKPTKGEAET